VPDIYQGSEVWNLSLVDPDNRRPVDFPLLEKMLEEIKTERVQNKVPDFNEMIKNPASGKIKLYFNYILLLERKKNPLLFLEGTYAPLYAEGELKNSVIAFSREYKDKILVVITGRFFTSLFNYNSAPSADKWNGTRINLPVGNFRNVITGKKISSGELDNIFDSIPFAVLIND
jgi:(1->4)-alpha-D-glucan 1-alpha-D-glucosylmutase